MKIGVNIDVRKILQWLDEVWLNGDMKENMTEEQYLESRKALEESGI